MKWWAAFLCCVVCGFIAVLAYGCGKADIPAQEGNTGFDGGTVPLTGACSPDGLTHECHVVTGVNNGILNCYIGTQTCENGTWGPCAGSGTVVSKSFKGVVSGGSSELTPLAFGPSADAGGCPQDPCDPFCIGISDNGDGGVCGSATPPTVQVPTFPFNILYLALSGGLEKDPLPCTNGPPDNCQFDEQCFLGVCLPNSTCGTECAGQPDFTVGLPCFDGTNWNFTVCNRGSVTAATGNLDLSINTGSPTGNAGACPGTNFPTGPAVNMGSGGNDKGECVINLATTPLGPGQCTTIVPATSPLCTATGGGAITNWSGDHFVVVNPQSAAVLNPLGGGEPLAECDTCNNYSAVSAGMAGLGAAACVTSSSCPSGGGGGCDGGITAPPPGEIGAAYGTLPGGFQQNNNNCHGASNSGNFVNTYTEGCQQPGPGDNPVGTCNDCSQGDMCCNCTANGCGVCTPWATATPNVGTCAPPPGCNGPDFTVATGCVLSNGDTVFAVCNRGNQPANAGTVRLGIDNGPPAGNHDCLTTGNCGGCGDNEGRGHCDIVLSTNPIAVQSCITVDIDNPSGSSNGGAGITCTGVNSSGNLNVLINESGTSPGDCDDGCVPAVAECDECNNWSARKVNASCTGLGAPPPPTNFTFTYTATCPSGTHPFWNTFTYDAVNTANGTINFSATTTPLATDGGVGTPTAGPFTIATAPPDPANCDMTGPGPTCPIQLDGADGGTGVFPLPADSNEVLTLTITVTSSGAPSPTVNDWGLTYDCVPSE